MKKNQIRWNEKNKNASKMKQKRFVITMKRKQTKKTDDDKGEDGNEGQFWKL